MSLPNVLEPRPMNETEMQPISVGRTLLVSQCVPPDLQGSSIIAEKLSHLFAREALVMAGEAAPGANEYQRDERLPPLTYTSRRWNRRGTRTIRYATFPLILFRLWRLAGRQKFDRVVAVFPDEVFLFAAYLVARWRGLEFWPYFHNTFVENRTGVRQAFAKWLLKRIFRCAPGVFVMSEGMREFFEQKYPGVRFLVLQHLNERTDAFQPGLPPLHTPLRFGFVGSINQSNLDAFRRLGQLVGALPDYEMTVYSAHPASAFANLGFAPEKLKHATLPDHELPAALAQHDVLIFPHGFEGGLSEVEYETIFPTRTIPYLLSGRPILAHSPPDSFLTHWLKKYDCAEVVEVKDLAALQTALDRLLHDNARRQQLQENARQAVQYFNPGPIAERLAELFAESPKTAKP